MKCLAVIPCYNDDSYLSNLIPDVKRYLDDVLIIDDGSKNKINDNYNCNIIRNCKNRGKGYSIKKALRYAKTNGFSHIITLDSDGQHSPDCIPDFISINPMVDLVLGKREFNKSMPVHRRLSNKLTSLIVSLFANHNVYDSQCGFRRYKVDSFSEVTSRENGFQYESEVLIKGLKLGRIVHVDIPTIYSDEKSSINNLYDTIKFIRLVFRSSFKR